MFTVNESVGRYVCMYVCCSVSPRGAIKYTTSLNTVELMLTSTAVDGQVRNECMC